MAKNLIDFKNETGEWQKFVCKDGSTKYTQAGKLWYAINSRCKVGGSIQKNSPSYVGSVNKFQDFQFFAEWCQSQTGYYVNTKFQLDKDLLGKGLKVYSEDTCLFLPREINHFLEIQPRGELLLGVRKDGGTWIAECGPSGTGLDRYLGRFDTQLAAALAYKERKEMIARLLANKWKNCIDERAYNAMMSYTIELAH